MQINDYGDYQRAVMRTMRNTKSMQEDLFDLAILMLGIIGEQGEVDEAAPAQREEEIGDLLWYLTAYEIRYRLMFGFSTPFPTWGLDRDCTRARAQAATQELAEHTKKVCGHGRDPDPVFVGRLLREISEPYDSLGSATHLRIMRANIAKLEDRYPEGFK